MPLLNIKCLVVEDEPLAQQVLQSHINQLSFLSLKGIASDVAQALSFLKEEAIDLVFSDIHLPGITGLHLAQGLPSATGIIFTTAHDQYAVQGFELNAVDYLLKPVSFERFEMAVNRYLRHFHQHERLLPIAQEEERPFLFLRCERKMTKIFLDEIFYLEAQRNYVLIQTKTGVYKTYQSISEAEEKLPAGHFLRVHRSFIVAVAQVKAVHAHQISAGQFTIPVGRSYYKEAMERIYQK